MLGVGPVDVGLCDSVCADLGVGTACGLRSAHLFLCPVVLCPPWQKCGTGIAVPSDVGACRSPRAWFREVLSPSARGTTSGASLFLTRVRGALPLAGTCPRDDACVQSHLREHAEDCMASVPSALCAQAEAALPSSAHVTHVVLVVPPTSLFYVL